MAVGCFGNIKWTSGERGDVQSDVRRAFAFSIVGTIVLITPRVGALTAVPFALIAVLARLVTSGPMFELLSRPGDRTTGQLQGLIGFSLGATALVLLTALIDLPVLVAMGAVLLVGYGNLVERVTGAIVDSAIGRVAGFTLGGFVLSFIGVTGGLWGAGSSVNLSFIGFLLLLGALVATTVRVVMGREDDVLVMITAGVFLWVITGFEITITWQSVALAFSVAGILGYLSWSFGMASLTGMLTGITMGFVTIVLGGWAWFGLLLSFFGIGGIASKYRIDEKRRYGVAESNAGARRSRNVIGNAAVALLAVFGYAASASLSVPAVVFLFAFTGSVATALADTLSSEIGVLCGRPRLITTFREVPPGTDGGVTLEGFVAGVVGALFIAVLTLMLFDIPTIGLFLVVTAGVSGMIADSVLGAVVEGELIGNQSVNFLATLSGAVIASMPVLLGIIPG